MSVQLTNACVRCQKSFTERGGGPVFCAKCANKTLSSVTSPGAAAAVPTQPR